MFNVVYNIDVFSPKEFERDLLSNFVWILEYRALSYILQYITLSNGTPWNISRATYIFFKSEFVYQENTNNKWVIPVYTKGERCRTILYHIVENTVVSTIR